MPAKQTTGVFSKHSSDGYNDGDAATSTAITQAPSLVALNTRYSITGMSGLVCPEPGTTYTIRSVSCGKVITLLEGKIELTEPNEFGCSHWACEDNDGWIGFRNRVSGGFLGNDTSGRVCCTSKVHGKTERLCTRMTPNEGCILLMLHEDGLHHVGSISTDGVEALFINRAWYYKVNKLGWEFTQV